MIDELSDFVVARSIKGKMENYLSWIECFILDFQELFIVMMVCLVQLDEKNMPN